MFQLGMIEVMQADREREIEAAVRRHRLLRREDGPTDRGAAPIRSGKAGTMAVRVRPTGG